MLDAAELLANRRHCRRDHLEDPRLLHLLLRILCAVRRTPYVFFSFPPAFAHLFCQVLLLSRRLFSSTR